MQQLSITETELRLVQRDMICVLQLPSADDPALPECQSFKRRTGQTETNKSMYACRHNQQDCRSKGMTIM